MPRITIPLLNDSYPSNSKVQSVRELVNFYLEEDISQERFIALGTPGFELWKDLSGSEVRGMKEHRGSGYVVMDSEVYKVEDKNTTALKGTLSTTTGRVSIAAIHEQILFVDGAKGWVYDITADTFTEITDVDFPSSPEICTALNGYFIVLNPSTDEFYVSDLNDGTSWTATSFAAAEVNSDNLVSAKANNTFLFLLGSETTEIWYNSGAETVPFDRAVAGALNVGCAAKFTPLPIDNTMYWLAQNENGFMGVVRSDGQQVEIISNRAMAGEIQSYTDLSTAFAWTYQENGHTFYNITFPDAKIDSGFTIGRTWSFDITTNKWNELRSNYAPSQLQSFESKHRANCHMYLNNEHLIGDYETGKIYKMAPTLLDDAGTEIIRRIKTTHIAQQDRTIGVHNLKVELENGVGLESGQGSDPMIGLRYSKDRGRTWSQLIQRSAGAIGEYTVQPVWNRLGSGKSITMELSVSDPIRWTILGASALVDVEGAINDQ